MELRGYRRGDRVEVLAIKNWYPGRVSAEWTPVLNFVTVNRDDGTVRQVSDKNKIRKS